MSEIAEPAVLPDVGHEEETDSKEGLDPGYLVICWDDPVNLMDYVSHVFQKVFGWTKEKAEFHMLQVHSSARAFWRVSRWRKPNITFINFRSTVCTRLWSAIR